MSFDDLFRVPDALAVKAASSITRRRLLRNTGGGALAFALGVSQLERPQMALANGSESHPCGPSPICDANWCAGGECNTNNKTWNRCYGTFSCCAGSPNCWGEVYASGAFSCCDCCTKHASGGAACSGGCEPANACICRLRA